MRYVHEITKYADILKIGSVIELAMTIEEGFIQKTRQRSSLQFGGKNLFNSLPR